MAFSLGVVPMPKDLEEEEGQDCVYSWGYGEADGV